MKKILVACPTYNGMEYCFNEFVDHLRMLDYPNFKIVIFDNSKSKKFYRKIKNNPWIKVIYDDTSEEDNMNRLISSRNKIIDYAINHNYDYLFMLDSDVMVPPYALNKLLSFNKDIVSGLYNGIINTGNKKMIVPIAFQSISQENFETLKNNGKLPNYIRNRHHIARHLNDDELKRTILNVSTPSGGCLLLSKKAFTSGAKYGLEDVPNKIFTSDDVYFFNRLRERKFKFYCSPDVFCNHLFEEKLRLNEGVHPLMN